MYKIITCLSLMIFLSFSSFSQTANWSWAAKGIVKGSFNYVAAHSMALDAGNGSIGFCGNFNDTVVFGSGTVIAPPTYTQGYLTKLTAAKYFSWSVLIGSRSYIFCNKAAAGNSGSYYVLGSCFDTVKVGALKSDATKGGSDFFVAKISSSGIPVWIRTGGGAFDDGILDMKSDNLFNPIALVTYNNSITIGSLTFSNATNVNRNAVLVKYRPNGAIAWAKHIKLPTVGGFLNDSRIAVDGSNNIYVFGTYTDAIQFGGITLTCPPGNYMGYLVKYNGAGTVQWATNTGTISVGQVWALEADNSGNVYCAGSFSNTASFGAISLTSALPGNNDGFIAKFNTSGSALWARKFYSNGNDIATGLSVNKSTGDVYVSGTVSGSAIFDALTLTDTKGGFENGIAAKYDASGNVIWARLIDGSGYTSAYCVAVDTARDAVYTGGYYSHNTFFDALRLSGGGTTGSTPFIGKIIETFGPRPIVKSIPDAQEQIEDKLTLYPNPAKSFTRLKLTFNKQPALSPKMIVLNSEGKQVLTRNASLQNGQINEQLFFNKMLPGTYHVSVIANGQTYVQKLIIE